MGGGDWPKGALSTPLNTTEICIFGAVYVKVVQRKYISASCDVAGSHEHLQEK